MFILSLVACQSYLCGWQAVSGLFMYGGSSHVEGTFMCEMYMWILVWNVQGLFTCEGSSCVEEIFHVEHTCEFMCGTCRIYSCVDLLTCRGHMNSCVEHTHEFTCETCRVYSHVEAPHVWGDIPCGTYMWFLMWNVQGLFMCGGTSHVEGTFTCWTYTWIYMWNVNSHVWGDIPCGTYMWFLMWNVQGLFMCGGSSHVEGTLTCWTYTLIYVWNVQDPFTSGGWTFTCGGDIHMWNVHVNSRVEHAGSIYVWRLSRVEGWAIKVKVFAPWYFCRCFYGWLLGRTDFRHGQLGRALNWIRPVLKSSYKDSYSSVS